MIRLIETGSYRLSEAGEASRLLTLDSYGDKCSYAWERVNGTQIRLAVQKPDETYSALAAGKYRVYEVIDEAGLTNQPHLELSLGEGIWQGYLLPEGFPAGRTTKMMIPVKELITKSFANLNFPTR